METSKKEETSRRVAREEGVRELGWHSIKIALKCYLHATVGFELSNPSSLQWAFHLLHDL